MILYLNDEIDDNWTTKVVEFINKLELENKTGVIYVSTVGGSLENTDAIIHLIENNKDKITKVVGHYNLSSGGFKLFYSITVPRELTPGTIGMWHQGSTAIEVQFNNKPTYFTGINRVKSNKKFRMKEGTGLLKKLGANKKELKIYKRGDDVCFSYKRMKEFLK